MPVSFHTPNEVAEQMGVTPDHVRLLCRRGQFGLQHRGDWLVHPDELAAMLAYREAAKPHRGRKTDHAAIRRVAELLEAGKNAAEIIAATKMQRSRVYRYIKQIRDEKITVATLVATASRSSPAAETPPTTCQ